MLAYHVPRKADQYKCPVCGKNFGRSERAKMGLHWFEVCSGNKAPNQTTASSSSAHSIQIINTITMNKADAESTNNAMKEDIDLNIGNNPVSNTIVIKTLKFHQPSYEKTTGSGIRESYNRHRDNYIAELHQGGIVINHVGNVWSKTGSGIWVAMPMATERVPNRWFLGIREDDILERNSRGEVTIVLLCVTEGDDMLDFVLPPLIVKGLLPKLSRSADGLKFNLKKTRTRYLLTLPKYSPVDLTEYRGKWTCLK